jgi:phospholipid transport system substrate-binding protein
MVICVLGKMKGDSMFRFIFSMLLGLLALGAQAQDLTPDQLAKNTTQEVLDILRTDKDIQAGNIKKAYQLVEARVLPHFDFNRMTQLAVGKYWNSASPQQKQSLVKEFRSLLVRTYAASLTEFSNQTVDFKPLNMRPDDSQVTVKTEIRQPGGKPIPIDYEMYKTDFGWKVFDVAIDGVSLVINYRSSFANTIRQSGIDGLISTLEAKSRNQDKATTPKAAPGKPVANVKPSTSFNANALPGSMQIAGL